MPLSFEKPTKLLAALLNSTIYVYSTYISYCFDNYIMIQILIFFQHASYICMNNLTFFVTLFVSIIALIESRESNT